MFRQRKDVRSSFSLIRQAGADEILLQTSSLMLDHTSDRFRQKK